MIRPFTCICMLMAAGSGLYLYQTKHRAQLLDREIAHTYDQIDQVKKRIGFLKNEWAMVNETERLAGLAHEHLSTLHTLAPNQFVSLADIGNRLPAPLPPGSIVIPVPDEAPAQNTSANPIPANTPVAAARPAAPKPAPFTPAPLQLATLPQPPAATPARPTPRPPTVPVTLPAPRLTAPIVNVSAPHASAPHALPPPVPTIVSTAITSPVSPAPAPLASRYAATAPIAPAFNNTPPFGSALGSAGHLALPAPVPYGAVVR